MRLVNDSQAIQDEFKFDPNERLLFSNIRRDSSKIVKPIIANVNQEKFLLVRAQETASVLFSDVPASRIKFHSPWITFDRALVGEYDVAENLGALVASLAGDEEVVLAPGIALTHQQEIKKRVSTKVEIDARDTAPVVVYEVTEKSVLAKFKAWRSEGVSYTSKIVANFTGLDGIETYFTDEVDTRFTALAQAADELGVSGLYISAPPNFSEVTGVSATDKLGALWVPGSGKVYIIADGDEYGVNGLPSRQFSSRATAIEALLSGKKVGVEEEWISASLAETFVQGGLELVSASSALGSWRDLRDVEDLPFQVIAARASTFAIERALTLLNEKLENDGSSTESQLYADYLEGIHLFRFEHKVPFGIEPYFVNLHASDRTLYPTTPTDALITKKSGCVELDSGVKVTADGVVLGTSDMGRSLPHLRWSATSV